MKPLLRLLVIALILCGCSALIYLSNENSQLAAEVTQYEAELGKMTINDASAIQIVEIAAPEVPPEVAPHVERLWQFRCYLPPGYDYIQHSGGGRVTKEGLYQAGGFSSSWGTPNVSAKHELLTISLQRNKDRVEVFHSFGGTGKNSWNGFKPENLQSLVVQKLASSHQGPRSFNKNLILPLLKVYDPNSASDTQVIGKSLTTYSGGFVALCPKSLETEWEQIRAGKMSSDDFKDYLAMPVSDE